MKRAARLIPIDWTDSVIDRLPVAVADKPGALTFTTHATRAGAGRRHSAKLFRGCGGGRVSLVTPESEIIHS